MVMGVRAQGKTSEPIILQIVGVMNLIVILFCSFNVQGREPYIYDFVENYFNVNLHSVIYRLISFQLGMMIGIIKFYILISV